MKDDESGASCSDLLSLKAGTIHDSPMVPINTLGRKGPWSVLIVKISKAITLASRLRWECLSDFNTPKSDWFSKIEGFSNIQPWLRKSVK